MDINKDLTKAAFENREYMTTHAPYEKEMEFYQSIKMGNVKEAFHSIRRQRLRQAQR